MERPERRLNSRTTLEEIAYISFGPDTGGIVLNVSDGGLCFRTVAAVQQVGTIHFWLSAQNKRIEGVAELAWTHESQKTGGLRFTAIPEEARQQIQSWIVRAMKPLAERPESSLSVLGTHTMTNKSWRDRPATDQAVPVEVVAANRSAPMR